nr:MAG TPA: hypothetical protein [Bacteriophage sp.]
MKLNARKDEINFLLNNRAEANASVFISPTSLVQIQ